MSNCLFWNTHSAFLFNGQKIGEFVAVESGLYEFCFEPGRTGGYIPGEYLEEIVRRWHELNDKYLEELNRNLFYTPVKESL